MEKKGSQGCVYIREFKVEAVALAEKREKPISQTVKDLGLNENVLQCWMYVSQEKAGTSRCLREICQFEKSSHSNAWKQPERPHVLNHFPKHWRGNWKRWTESILRQKLNNQCFFMRCNTTVSVCIRYLTMLRLMCLTQGKSLNCVTLMG